MKLTKEQRIENDKKAVVEYASAHFKSGKTFIDTLNFCFMLNKKVKWKLTQEQIEVIVWNLRPKNNN